MNCKLSPHIQNKTLSSLMCTSSCSRRFSSEIYLNHKSLAIFLNDDNVSSYPQISKSFWNLLIILRITFEVDPLNIFQSFILFIALLPWVFKWAGDTDFWPTLFNIFLAHCKIVNGILRFPVSNFWEGGIFK